VASNVLVPSAIDLSLFRRLKQLDAGNTRSPIASHFDGEPDAGVDLERLRHVRPMQRGDMHKVFMAVIASDEAKASIEPRLHFAKLHLSAA
jgi:hypothetical protein